MLADAVRRQLFGEYAMLGSYEDHPTERRSSCSSACSRNAWTGLVSEDLLRDEMAPNHVRHDAFEVIERTPPLAA